jgi:hypothetical protein
MEGLANDNAEAIGREPATTVWLVARRRKHREAADDMMEWLRKAEKRTGSEATRGAE